MSKAAFVSLVSGGVVLLDQLTKWYVRQAMPLYDSLPVIDGFFSITHALPIEDRIHLSIAKCGAQLIGIDCGRGRRRRQVVQCLCDTLRVDERDGCTTVRTRAIFGQVDRCAALRTNDLPDARPELGQLFRRRRADEVLLAKELGEGDELSMTVRATPIGEMSRSLQIMGKRKSALATRTPEARTERCPGACCSLADVLKQAQHCLGHEAHAFVLVEPEKAAARTDFNLDGVWRCVGFLAASRHRLMAVRAADLRCQRSVYGVPSRGSAAASVISSSDQQGAIRLEIFASDK